MTTRREKIAALAATAPYNENEAANAAAKLALLPRSLEDIAEAIRAEWGKGIEAEFSIGRLLSEARSLHGDDDKSFGIWLKSQAFGFSGSTAYNLRVGFEREGEVRSFLASRSSASRDMGVNTAIARMTRQPVNEITRGKTEIVEDIGFAALRAGIHRLLGWEVDEDGFGRPTRNGLIALPEDQLAELKSLVEQLATAFGAAVKTRRAA